MIYLILGSIVGVIVYTGIIFWRGYSKGYKKANVENLEKAINDTIETNKRRAIRSSDSINDVDKRLLQDARD